MVIWQWELGQLCLLPGYTDLYSCISDSCVHMPGCFFFFLSTQKIAGVTFKFKCGSEIELTSRAMGYNCGPKSMEEKEEDMNWMGVEGQDNGWPEQYITLRQISLIRIHNKHHGHITLTWDSCTYMPVKMREFSFSGLKFQPIATTYCSGSTQLNEQASLATSSATGTAILHS